MSRYSPTTALEQALGVYRDLGDRGGEVEVINEAGTLRRVCGDLGLGRCLLAASHSDEGEGLLRRALEIFQRIGAAEAAEPSAELQALTDARPGIRR